MSSATPPSGSIDESIAFRQGVSVVTIKDQLTGMLPKFSAGTRSRIVIDGNAPDSDVYFDDSMIGMGPGTIVMAPPEIKEPYIFDFEFDEFIKLSKVDEPDILEIELSGSYSGDNDATFRLQIADPSDDDVFTMSNAIFEPTEGSSGLNDVSVILENLTETDADGNENILITSGTYDASAGISVYKVEIATAHEGAVETIRWYKDNELLTDSAGEIITPNNGNELIDGDNRVVIKFEYDGYGDFIYDREQKHTVGDAWYIIAGAQQFRWVQAEFDDSNGMTIDPVEGTTIAVGAPTGIVQSDYQHLADGVYIRFPAQVGYSDGTVPGEDPPTWEFKVTSLKPDAAITAMQESAGRIEVYPDHRVEQRDFGQPKFHNDFDVNTQKQAQVSTIEVLRLAEIGEQNPETVNTLFNNGVTPRTPSHNTQLYTNTTRKKFYYSRAEADQADVIIGLDIEATPDPLERGWHISDISDDGSVGPYFFLYDLHWKHASPRKNYFWYNFGNTTTLDIEKYDDKDPNPPIATGLPYDVSGRELDDITFSGNDEETSAGHYEIYCVDAMEEIPEEVLVTETGQSYWTNDGGVTFVSAEDAKNSLDITVRILLETDGFPTNPTSYDSSGNQLWKLVGTDAYLTALDAGWDPDINEDDDSLSDMMSEDINGDILFDSTDTPAPLSLEDWMIYHGYVKTEITEVEWMLREGYIAGTDVLHNKWFTMYDFDYQAYYVKFIVNQNPELIDLAVPAIDDLVIEINPDISDLDHDDDTTDTVIRQKSKEDPVCIHVHIDIFDKASDIALKIIDRLNKVVPHAALHAGHPFFQGADVSTVFEAVIDDSDDHIVDVALREFGRVQESENSGNFPEGFQCWRQVTGSHGYCIRVLDDSNYYKTPSYPKKTLFVGKFWTIYNSTAYWYPAKLGYGKGHDDLPFTVGAENQFWSNDKGKTASHLSVDGIPATPALAWAAGYAPYVGIDEYKPHVIYYNVGGISKPPAGPKGQTEFKMHCGCDDEHEALYYYELWSYDIDDEYRDEVRDAFDYGRTLEVRCFPQSIDRAMAYLTEEKMSNSEQFIVPFMTSTPANQNIVRAQQRDVGPVITTSDDLDDIAPHKGNCPISIENHLPGLNTGIVEGTLDERDREYICDTMVFSHEDDALFAQRFRAEKRIVENYGTFEIKCVAEEKHGKLFDYSDQAWTNFDASEPGATWKVPGGSSDLSNYEPNTAELFDTVPNKEITLADGTKVTAWRRSVDSNHEFTASSVGYDSSSSMYDSSGRKIWRHDLDGTFCTASSLGLEDDDVDDAGLLDGSYSWGPDPEDGLTEEEWMTYEGYLIVPSFTHKIAQAAYFYLPHPEKNFYVWFDVAQLSADPGDDGTFDLDLGITQDETVDVSYIGGAARIALDSYTDAGDVAIALVNRINSDRFDTGKKHTQVNIDDDGNPVYQALVAGNLNKHFYAEISDEDSSVVIITCLKSGLINVDVAEKNNSLILPVTESGDQFTITLLDDGDTDYFVDVYNLIPGTVLPPNTDTVNPDADSNLVISINEEPYTPSQPGVTKTVSSFLPYEDMQSLTRGYRETNEDGIEIARGGPVAFIEDDDGSLIYPVIMSNVSMKDPDQYDGVLEPLEIRSRASRNSPDAYFAAHDIRGMLQTDVAEDSRKRSNPITQFINTERTYFEPYEDGIEHMESSPAVESFLRTPVFYGTGLNDMEIVGTYLAPAGSQTETYSVKCTVSYPYGSEVLDKFEWSKSGGEWSESTELTYEGVTPTEIILTYSDLGLGAVSEYQELILPGGIESAELDIFCKGDIDSASEYYRLQYYNEETSSWTDVVNDVGDIVEMNKDSHPDIADTRHRYSSVPHYSSPMSSGSTNALPIFKQSSILIRIWSSPNVTLGAFDNSVKVRLVFARKAAKLDLDNGIYAVFDSSTGHNTGDVWSFEAIAKSHEDAVGCAPLPGYLTWQESKITPFTETSYIEQATANINDPIERTSYATGSLIFNYTGYTGEIYEETDEDPVSLNTTWEIEYLRSLNGQAFTLIDSAENQVRFEFDNDGVLENEGDELISVLRPEVYYIRFPDIDNHFQRRDQDGEKLWVTGQQEFIVEEEEERLLWHDPAAPFTRFTAISEDYTGVYLLADYSDIDCEDVPGGCTNEIPNVMLDGVEDGDDIYGVWEEEAWAAHHGYEPTYISFNKHGKTLSDVVDPNEWDTQAERFVDGTYLPYTDEAFSEITQEEWAEGYGFAQFLTTPEDISENLSDIKSYAGKHFVITDSVITEEDHVLNTIKGGRYAVWFNILDMENLDDAGDPVPVADAPDFANADPDVILYYDYDSSTYKPATTFYHLDGTTELSGLGYTGYYEIVDDVYTNSDDLDGLDADGDEIANWGSWTEDEWAIYNDYYSTKITKLARWSNDSGDTIVAALPTDESTGWNPDPDTQTMNVNHEGDGLYTFDDGDTVIVYDLGGDEEAEALWASENGYIKAELDEIAWHTSTFWGDSSLPVWEDYLELKPQLIEVIAKSTDSIQRLASNTIKAVKKFKNPNQSRMFFAEYVRPPTYSDNYDLPHPEIPSSEDLSDWRPTDYDDVLWAKLEDNWFNQYANDPDSPPVSDALGRGWLRGWFTIKITSRNLGYHKVDTRTATSILPGDEGVTRSHEPGYYADLEYTDDVRTFQVFQDPGIDWGGHRTFEQLINATSDSINNSSLDMTAIVRYDSTLGPRTGTNLDAYKHGLIEDVQCCEDDSYYNEKDCEDAGFVWTDTPRCKPKESFAGTWYVDQDETNTQGKLVFISDGADPDADPEYRVFVGNDLFENILMLSPTSALQTIYTYKSKLCGIDLLQATPGPAGNTKVTFHYYDENFKGNIIKRDFTGGFTAGPYADEVISSMNMSTNELRPHNHISSTAGIVYNDMPCGTDSIAFGGWKK